MDTVEPPERDQRLRIVGRARLVVDEDAGDIERHGMPQARADQVQHQSSAGEAPPVVNTGPSMT